MPSEPIASSDILGQQQPYSAANATGQAATEHFDNYLSKLQTICNENMAGSAGVGAGMAATASNVGDGGKQVYDSMKSALQGFNTLPAARI